MPFSREHAARTKSPRGFLKGTFRSKTIAPGVRLVVAKKCSRCSMETQAVRFDVCLFSPTQARRWLRHYHMRPIEFESASETCSRRR